jgi:hypothetical protein
MKKFSIEMPEVKDCEVTSCVYNVKNACHARAITVGDGANARCDTFFNASSHSKGKQMAGVGACKVTACSYNNDYECQAEGVSIGMEQNNAICVTFSP